MKTKPEVKAKENFEAHVKYITFRKIRDILIPIVTLCLIIGTSIAVIAYGRGYRLDVFQKSLKPTGLLAATSDPTGAQILIDGKLESATNNTINVPPGWYTVTIAKEGFQTWEKKIGIRGEVVSRADAYLFPSNPSLAALTTSGVTNPALSPDGSRLAYLIPHQPEATADGILATRAGIWILDLTDRPLGFNRDARQIASMDVVDFSDAILFWSPDSKQIVATITHSVTLVQSKYLLDAGELNTSPQRIFNLATIQSQWDELSRLKEKEKISGLPRTTVNTMNQFMDIISFSPDETKILYEASISGSLPNLINPPLIGINTTEEDRNIKIGNIYVYDIKEDRNYIIGETEELLPKPTPTKNTIPLPTLQWFPTNRHLLYITKGKIQVMEYDAKNRKTIYSGPFEKNFVVPWTNTSKILILTNLNASTGTLPNLYAVNLR